MSGERATARTSHQHVSRLGAERLITKASPTRASPKSHDAPCPQGAQHLPRAGPRNLPWFTSPSSPLTAASNVSPHPWAPLELHTHPSAAREGPDPHGSWPDSACPSHTSFCGLSLWEASPPLHASPELLSVVSVEEARVVPVMGNPHCQSQSQEKPRASPCPPNTWHSTGSRTSI